MLISSLFYHLLAEAPLKTLGENRFQALEKRPRFALSGPPMPSGWSLVQWKSVGEDRPGLEMEIATGRRLSLPLPSQSPQPRHRNHLNLVEFPENIVRTTLLPTRSSEPFELGPRLRLRPLGSLGLMLFTLRRLGASQVIEDLRRKGWTGFKQGLRQAFSPDWEEWLEFHSDWDEFDYGEARTIGSRRGEPSFLCLGWSPKESRISPGFSVSYGAFPKVSHLRESGELTRRTLVILRSSEDHFLDHAFPLLAVAVTQHPEALLFYADEERRVHGRRDLWAKPAWSPMLHRSSAFPGSVLAFRPEALAAVPGHTELKVPAILRALSGKLTPYHLPYAISFQERAPTLTRSTPAPTSIQDPFPSVEAIIPTRDRLDLLSPLIEDLKRTDYPHLSLTIVDHESRDPETLAFLRSFREEGHRVVPVDGPFNFSRLCNRGAEKSSADALLLLNNDLRLPEPEWLRSMTSLLEEGVGAVGALLLFPSGRVQHAGVALGVGQGVAGHLFRGRRPEEVDSFLFDGPREVSAVTAACLLTPRSLWKRVGGFDEENFPVAYNDVHYCLRLQALGQRILWTPHAVLEHLESESRGADVSGDHRLRLNREADTMKSYWGELLQRDPYYHPAFSLKSEQGGPAIDPRISFPWRGETTPITLRSPSVGKASGTPPGEQEP